MESSLTFNVSPELAAQLRPFENRITQVIELGLREIQASSQSEFQGAAEVLELLASLPSSEEILALKPTEALQNRIQELLDKNQQDALTPEEEQEWARYQYLEHLVRLAKAQALLKQKKS